MKCIPGMQRAAGDKWGIVAEHTVKLATSFINFPVYGVMEDWLRTLVINARAARPRQLANAHGTENHDIPPSIYTRSVQTTQKSNQKEIQFKPHSNANRRTYAFVVDSGALAMA
jgi:hypothetical protein